MSNYAVTLNYNCHYGYVEYNEADKTAVVTLPEAVAEAKAAVEKYLATPLSLDVPQVHRSEQAFARLRDVGAALAEAMDGVLCDQNGQPLPAMAMDPIAADLELLYDQLDARDLSAGSVLARRLFS